MSRQVQDTTVDENQNDPVTYQLTDIEQSTQDGLPGCFKVLNKPRQQREVCDSHNSEQ